MTATTFMGPQPFQPGSNNPVAAWREYRDSFKIYALAAKLTIEPPEIQVATFLHIVGASARRIYNTFDIDQEETTLQHVYTAFDEYYAPFNNLIAFRYTFFTTFQSSQQPFADFLTDLKTKASNCEFSTLKASLICTQIVCGIRKEELRKQLLAKRNLTLDDAISICLAEEAATRHATTIATEVDKTALNNIAVDELRHHQRRPGTTRKHPDHDQRQGPRSHDTQRGPSNHRPPQHGPPRNGHVLNRQQQQIHRFDPRKPRERRCPNCNTQHRYQERCPAQNATCYQCSRQGHWASCCNSRNVHETTAQNIALTYQSTEQQSPIDDNYATDYRSYQEAHDNQNDWQDEEREGYNLYCNELTLHCHDMQAAKTTADEWFETIYFANFPTTMKLDTGSQVNIIHQGIYDKFPIKPPLDKPQYTVKTYSGHTIDIMGVINVRCASFANSADHQFYVTPHKTVPILGARASVELGLITRHTKIPRHNTKAINATTAQKRDEVPIPPPMPTPEEADRMTPEEIVHMYRDVFDKVGKLPGKHKIQLKPRSTPTICAPRQIPHALQNGVRKELDRLQALEIITPVSTPTDWVHPMVVVLKPNKLKTGEDRRETSTGKETNEPKIRICLDPRNLNAAIKKEPYPTPTAQEIFSRLHGAEIFTVFDAQSAFWQVELDDESSYLCTFATPFGRYRFKRLALGICTSSSVFQRIMHEIYPPAQFPNTQISTDDFLIATSRQTHNREMIKILERARQNGLTFSRDKMQLASRSIIYLGLTITPNGLEIAPSKIQAIRAIPSPEDRAALQRFLGMVNFLAKFLSHHSTEAAPLRALLKKGAAFSWDANAEATLEQLKQLITTAPVLAFFNPKRPITISVDSSRIGVGAVLLQDQKPVEYASTSFTSTQQNYAPIERELLGIVYACERFHYYITGTTFTVNTDHRPLTSIVKKPLYLLSPRLQRLVLRLTRYNLKVEYVPGSQLYVADTLSRAPRKEEDINTDDLEGPYAVVHTTTALPKAKLTQFQNVTARDSICQTLTQYINQGWPTAIGKLHTPIKPFWPMQDEIHQKDGLIYRGERLYVPDDMRKEIIQQIHSAHQGITACLARAKQQVYWPQMTADITEEIKQCHTCQQRQRANIPLPLHPHIIPRRPWEVVGSDLFHIGNKTFVILVDYFSKFVEAEELRTTTAEALIKFLNPHFARHGAPQKLVSDNGPPYNSQLFRNFLEQWGIDHTTSSPHHPQSNGMTERTIQTIKNMAIKAHEDGKDIQRTLMEYRATPIGRLPSPAEMLMGRRIRTPLVTTTESLRPHFPIRHIANELQERQKTMTQNPRPAQIPEPLQLTSGTEVYHYIEPRKWGRGLIVSRAPEPQAYNIRVENGRILRRTRHQLRPLHQQKGSMQNEAKTQDRMTQLEIATHQNPPVVTTSRRISTRSTRTQDTPAVTNNEQARSVHRTEEQVRMPKRPHPFPKPIAPSPIPGRVPPFTETPISKTQPERPRRPIKFPDRLTYYHN